MPVVAFDWNVSGSKRFQVGLWWWFEPDVTLHAMCHAHCVETGRNKQDRCRNSKQFTFEKSLSQVASHKLCRAYLLWCLASPLDQSSRVNNSICWKWKLKNAALQCRLPHKFSHYNAIKPVPILSMAALLLKQPLLQTFCTALKECKQCFSWVGMNSYLFGFLVVCSLQVVITDAMASQK